MKSESKLEALPLCVDLDGTLVRTDTLVEALLLLCKRHIGYVFFIVWWSLRGKAHLKHEVTERVTVRIDTLPYHQDFLAYLRQQKESGRTLALVTASNVVVAEAIAQHTDLFSEVIASDQTLNVLGKHKAAVLVERFGKQGFVYAGNSWADLAVWRMAAGGIVVNASQRVLRSARRVTKIVAHFPGAQWWQLPVLLGMLRSHQWVKNLLLLLPVLTAHQFGLVTGVTLLLAIASFSAMASVVYIINDLLDVESDREHLRKRHRPFASGLIMPHVGLVFIPVLLAVSVGLAGFLPPLFGIYLALYFGVTLAYSLYLKRILLLDVITLALLYTLRVFAGAAAASIAVSFWLALFALFFFLSLAFVKRFSELRQLEMQGRNQVKGRGYQVGDMAVVMQLGVASGLVAVLVQALYINTEAVTLLYSNPAWLWLLSPLLTYWMGRVWLLAQRGAVEDDPVAFAVRDRISYAVIGASLLVLLVAAV